MPAAYLNQFINVAVAILMVPLLLRYLDVGEFVLWSIFTTFGAITLQFESAIQSVAVREIAREHHSGNAVTLRAAISKAKRAYTTLSACVIVPFLAIGILYLSYVGGSRLGIQASLEWVLFTCTYAINYYFGANNSILLGMARVTRFSNINSLTRVLNFVCTYLLLKAGLSILGICLSFASSVLIGCVLISHAAKQTLKNHYATRETQIRSDRESRNADSSNIVKHALYSLLSFAVYKSGLLSASAIFQKDIVAVYSLSLQACTILSAIALVPLQVWLPRLVSAIALGNRQKMLHELAVSLLAADTVFIAGAVLLVLFGNTLLALVGSRVILADNMLLVLLCVAFLVELNILLLVHFLATVGNYKFAEIYVATSLSGIALAIFLIWGSKMSLLALIAIPLGFQAILCLPLILRITCFELGITPMMFLSQLGRLICLRS